MLLSLRKCFFFFRSEQYIFRCGSGDLERPRLPEPARVDVNRDHAGEDEREGRRQRAAVNL